LLFGLGWIAALGDRGRIAAVVHGRRLATGLVAALPHASIVAVTVLADASVVVAADLVDAGAVAVTELNDLAVVVTTALEGLGTVVVAVLHDGGVLPAYADDASESTAAETRRMERNIVFSPCLVGT
jgi:hypothetical protein